MHRKIPNLIATTIFALFITGCASSERAYTQSILLPDNAKLIAYGQYVPMTFVPNERGTLYFVDEESRKVAYVMTLTGMSPTMPLNPADLPPDMAKSFQKDHHYRLYFAAEPATHPNIRDKHS